MSAACERRIVRRTELWEGGLCGERERGSGREECLEPDQSSSFILATSQTTCYLHLPMRLPQPDPDSSSNLKRSRARSESRAAPDRRKKRKVVSFLDEVSIKVFDPDSGLLSYSMAAPPVIVSQSARSSPRAPTPAPTTRTRPTQTARKTATRARPSQARILSPDEDEDHESVEDCSRYEAVPAAVVARLEDSTISEAVSRVRSKFQSLSPITIQPSLPS